jgi:hypothetical protein
MTMTTTDAAAVLNAMRGTAYAAWTPYLCAFTAAPPTDGTFANELSGGSYARQPVTFAVPSAKSSTNSAAISFSATAGTVITHIGLADAVSTGGLRRYAALGSSVTVGTSGVVTVAIGALADGLT